MPNPNAVVSITVRLQPPLDRTEDEAQAAAGFAVELDDDRRVILDPADSRSIGFARILDGLRRLGRPVYLEIDPTTDTVIRLLVPHVARVASIGPSRGAVLDIELDPSHARHLLRLNNADSADLERQLRAAMQTGQPMIVVEDDGHNIIDVRDFTPLPEGPLPPFPPVPLSEPRLAPGYPWPFSWLWWLMRWLWGWSWGWWYCPSSTRAQQVFDAMAAASCDPLTVPAPCIPFRYPDDGCWARAHEMCRLMIAMGLSPDKVWIDHSTGYSLHVSTRNSPQCFVEWGWHVAPTLCVRGPWFLMTRRMVIDPSLFTTPVTEGVWKGVQGDPGAVLTHTGADQFWHVGGTDPAYTSSNAILAQYRLALQTRSVQVGPPPFANCP